jgi:DNA-binding NarL/FixJ family response regulator
MARILIADDHPDIRAGVRALLSRNPDCEVCGEAKNGREAVEKVQQLVPDLIVLDVSMPVMGGIEAAREIRRIAPATKIILFSMYEDRQTETAGRQAGADAIIRKSEAATSLMPAVERLSNGHGRG